MTQKSKIGVGIILAAFLGIILWAKAKAKLSPTVLAIIESLKFNTPKGTTFPANEVLLTFSIVFKENVTATLKARAGYLAHFYNESAAITMSFNKGEPKSVKIGINATEIYRTYARLNVWIWLDMHVEGYANAEYHWQEWINLVEPTQPENPDASGTITVIQYWQDHLPGWTDLPIILKPNKFSAYQFKIKNTNGEYRGYTFVVLFLDGAIDATSNPSQWPPGGEGWISPALFFPHRISPGTYEAIFELRFGGTTVESRKESVLVVA